MKLIIYEDFNVSDGHFKTLNVSRSIIFKELIANINKILKNNIIDSFEYVDEEGDCITVRDDEDLYSVITYYDKICNDSTNDDCENLAIKIYPKICMQILPPPLDVPLVGLDVLACSTGSGSTDGVFIPSSPSISPQIYLPNSSSMIDEFSFQSGDIEDIISRSSVGSDDLEYLETLCCTTNATVYKALHKPNGRSVAVKRLQLKITLDTQKQILRELAILRKCNSAHIISFEGAFFVDNAFHLVTEYMDGRSLDRYGRVPEDILGAISVAVVRGLLYLWERRIMHRDVKPSNMLVNTFGQVKLCDFGVSIQLVESVARTYIGTNAYMSPERILGEEYRIHSDVWSLGVSLYELAKGELPFVAPDAMTLMVAIIQNPAPSLPCGIFSTSLVDFVFKCLEKTPELRPGSSYILNHDFFVHHNHAENETVISNWLMARLIEVSFIN